MTATSCGAHAATVNFQRLVAQSLPSEDGQDLADAQRGFVGTVPDADVRRADGASVWNLAAYGFLA